MKKTIKKEFAPELDPRLVPLIAAFAKDPRVTSGGKGFGAGALKVRGKIFAMVSSKGKFVLKLPKARVAELVQLGKGEHFDPGKGKLMKEWLVFAGTPSSRLLLAREAHRFVLGDEE